MAIAWSLLTPRVARGKDDYFFAFATKYGTAGTRLHTCAVCHELDGGLISNPTAYAFAFANQATHQADPNGALHAIAGDDSDGDGWTNLTEILARYFPGHPTDKPGVGLTVPITTGSGLPGGPRSPTRSP